MINERHPYRDTFKLNVIKVVIPGESFWINFIGEDSRYIYGTVANQLFTVEHINFGDLVKINKETNKLTQWKPLQKNIIYND